MKSKIRYGLVGCGRICYKHRIAIKESGNSELIAVCDIIEERAKKVADEEKCDYYPDIKKMLKREDIDIVDICTPNYTHPELIKEAAKAGKHVLSEKPLALTEKDALDVTKFCEKQGVKLYVVKQNRYNPPIIKLKQALDQKRFGKLVLGNTTVRWFRPQSYYDESPWHGRKEKDGGMLFNQASHHIDMLQWLMGPVESVQAKIATLTHKIETEDTAVAILKFKNGALGTIEATASAGPKNTEGSVSIVGEKGTAKVGGCALNRIDVWEFQDFTNEDELVKNCSIESTNVYGIGHTAQIKDVSNALLSGKLVLVDGYEAAKSIKIIEAMLKSAETGKEIFLK